MAGEKWTLTQIAIKSFLGVGPSGLTIDLDRTLTVLQGPSGSGKSTIVSAVEWALFGNIETPPDYSVTGIGNNNPTHRSVIHRGQDGAIVCLQFQKGDSTLSWTRTRIWGTPKPDEDSVSCLINDSEAEADPKEIFGLDHNLYTRGVAPKQATLRNLVHFEKAERNEALDHLFGIEHLNNLTVGLSKGHKDIGYRVKNLVDRHTVISSRLRGPIKDQFDKRKQARQIALDAGITKDRLTSEALDNDLRCISIYLGEEPPSPPSNGASLEWHQDLLRSLEAKAERVWITPGPQDRLQRLTNITTTVPDARSDWQKSLEIARQASGELNELIKSKGNEESLTRAITEANKKLETTRSELAEADSKAAVLERARAWLSEHSHESDSSCPVCQRSIEASDLSKAIESSLEILRGSDGAIARLENNIKQTQDEKDLAEREAATVTAAVSHSASMATVATRRREGILKLVSEVENRWKAVEKLDEQEQKVNQLLCSISKFSPDDEGTSDKMDSLLRDLISEATQARDKTVKEVEKASEDVKQVRDQIIATQRLCGFLIEDEKLSKLDVTLKDHYLAEVGIRIEDAKAMESTVRTLAEVAGVISNNEATNRTKSLAVLVNKWFGMITRHDLLKGVAIKASVKRMGGIVRNSYEIKVTETSSSNETPAGNNLSGGYEMVLAVSALCAIQEHSSLSHCLGLFILDEPTESLDQELGEAMGQALGLHAPKPRTIITTNRLEFAKVIEDNAGPVRAKIINLGKWTASNGTRFEGCRE